MRESGLSAWLAPVALYLCASLAASRRMLSARCWQAAPWLRATPSHRAVPLGSCAGGGTAPAKDGACDRAVNERQCMCASWRNEICLMQSVCVLPAAQRGWRRAGWNEKPLSRGKGMLRKGRSGEVTHRDPFQPAPPWDPAVPGSCHVADGLLCAWWPRRNRGEQKTPHSEHRKT